MSAKYSAIYMNSADSKHTQKVPVRFCNKRLIS